MLIYSFIIIYNQFALTRTVKCPNSPLLVYLLPRYTDVLWEFHINCQNDKMFGQANGTLKIFKLLPWFAGVAMETQTGGEGHFFDIVAKIRNWPL